jgi:lipoprotein-anchoring transpeptidase ErfK/SrfK
MKSSQARTSRAMVAIVGGTLLLSVIFWSYNLGKQHATASATSAAPRAVERSATPDPVAPQVAIAPPTTAPTVLETPTTKPTSNLMLGAVTNIPSTQPGARVAAAPAPTTAPSGAAQTASATVIPTSLADAKSKFDQGRLLEARRGLNALLAAGSLSDADLQSAKQLLSQINATVVFSPRKFEDDEFGGTFTVPPGGVLQKIASSHEVSTDLLMRINGIKDARRLQAGKTIKVLKGPFHAVISKKNFSLELWLGNPGEKGSMFITAFPVGLGKDDSTPTGTWAVINKLKNPAYYSPRGEGVISADDPKNPLGEYWIGLAGTDGHAVGKTSYGIHGTTDPTSIGKQESMGCIRLKNEDAAQVYEMLVEGKSLVVVKD